jgi:transposase
VPRENKYQPKSKHASIHDAVVKAYTDGMSMHQVASMFQVSYGYVSRQLKKRGVNRTHLKGKSQLGRPVSEAQKNKHRATKSSRKEQGLYDHVYLKRTGYTYAEFQKRRPEFKKYHQQVRSITQAQPLDTLENYDKRGKAGLDGAYHIDHKFSVIEGFKQGVDPSIIGHISNLHMIPYEVNVVKQGECWISLQELKSLYAASNL